MLNAVEGLLFMVRFAPAPTAIALAAWGMAHAEFQRETFPGATGLRGTRRGPHCPGISPVRCNPPCQCCESPSTLSSYSCALAPRRTALPTLDRALPSAYFFTCRGE